MPRRIILLSDGTGNSAAKVWRTNVWRVFESLDLSTPDQVACYDDGVGTSAFKPLAILGGAFGYGLKRNVIDLYEFACRNVRNQDDEIYGFGFSRGAFTIRIVTGLILEQGLVSASSEQELHVKAKAAYRAFRAENFHTFWRLETPIRWVRERILRSNYSKADNRHDINVRFLGLWDTVAAYGMPIEEMARGISQWLFPWQMPDYRLNDGVKRACHALSVDDERTTFHPVLWDERNEKPLPARDGKRCLNDERISQVWFPGVHSNVGGGYPDDSLAQISLAWIMSEAKRCGLVFKSLPDANPQTIGHPVTAQDKDGRIYDPRRGIGGYYRYGPRNLSMLGNDLLARGTNKAVPKIHESVFERVRNNAHSYAPKGLPQHYEIVTAAGEVLPPAKSSYETAEQAKARSNLQEKVWNTIWLRRIVYFLTVAVSVYLVTFPLMKALPSSAELSSRLRWISDLVRLVGSILPSAAAPWINGYARDPGQFVVVSAALVGMLLWGSWLSSRIDDRMGVLWRQSLKGKLVDQGKPGDLIYRLRTHPIYLGMHAALKKYIAPALSALLFAYLGLTLASHALFNIQDDAGLVCREKAVAFGKDPANPRHEIVTDYKGLRNLAPDETMEVVVDGTKTLPEFKTSELCQSMGVWLERNGRYLIRFDSTESFFDSTIKADMGFYSTEPRSLLQKAIMISAVPLRRELIRPWFRVVARIGGTGGEETFLDPDTSDKFLIDEVITATRDGELFLFVNDAVIGIPRLYRLFYRNNKGSTKVSIKRLARKN